MSAAADTQTGDMINRVYISGPMTGLPDHNFPAFHLATARLRALGHQVESPAENPVPVCGGTWEGYMRLAIGQLITCSTIVMLPGWETSRGARIEHQLARWLDIRILDGQVYLVP